MTVPWAGGTWPRPTRLTESPSGSAPSRGTRIVTGEPPTVPASRGLGTGAELASSSRARTSISMGAEEVCPSESTAV